MTRAELLSQLSYTLPLKDLARRSAIYGVPITLANGFFMSAVNSACVTAAENLWPTEKNSFEKNAVTALSLALSTLTLFYVGVPLIGRLSSTFSRQVVIKIAFIHALCETSQVVIPIVWDKICAPSKSPETTKELSELNSRNIRFMVDHFEDFLSMPSDVRTAFEKRAKAEKLPFPTKPESAKEVLEFTPFEISYIFHNSPKYLPLEHDVMTAFETRAKALKLPFPSTPETKKEVDDLSPLGVLYLYRHFEDHISMLEKPKAAFDLRVATQHLIPSLATTISEVKALNFYDVLHIFNHYENYTEIPTEIESETREALHLRFYMQDLPFPEVLTVDDCKKRHCDYPLINLEPPKTVKEVSKLTANQLSWMFGSIVQNNYSMASLNINTQVALYRAFSTNIPKRLTMDPLSTAKNLAEISDESANWLYEFYGEELDKFICLPPAFKATLNEKFQELKNDTFETSYDLDALRYEYATIQGKDPVVWHKYFRNNEDAWRACGIRKTDTLNNLFEVTEGLYPLPVPPLLMGPQKQSIFDGLFA